MNATELDLPESRTRTRTQELFTRQIKNVWSSTDKLFISVLVVQWIAEIAISIWMSPRTWVGVHSFVHPHTWEAIVWGGAIISLPCLLAIRRPGQRITRLVIAVAQGLSSALLIHLTDGRIESHFHVFASLALLAFYRDWRVILLSSTVVTLGHLIGGIWWPLSVYGTPVADPWRFVEHATWVVIEDAFLLIFCRQSIAELKIAAERQVQFELINSQIEEQVLQRTESLRLSEERFELSLQGSRIGICDWDLLTNRVYWSTRVNEILGLQPGELDETLHAGTSRLHPDDCTRVLREIQATRDEGRPFHQEFRLRMKSGEYCWVEARGNCILDANGTPYRCAGGLTDITARKQIEGELAQRDEQLRQSHKLEAIGSLAGGIAHEFNNLLQAIRGYTNYAMEDLPTAEQRYQDLQQVLNAADRAAALTQQLLGFSRHQALNRRELLPEKVVKDLISMLRPLIGAQIEVITHIAGDLGRISADPVQLQQMLLNLCINARDAMPSGGQLTLTAKRRNLNEKYCELHALKKTGPYMHFSVTDNGCGMSPEVMQRIFEPFFTTKEVGLGTGLGLSMVYGIVQQHDGCINVYSEPEVGTTFNILLPILEGAVPDAKGFEHPNSPGGLETILVAEDETMVRNLTVRILTRAGYTVLTAADGIEALDVFTRHEGEISLALIDAVMPRLSGHGLSEMLRAQKPSLPIVFCTGYDPESGQLQFLMDRELSVVQKPFDPDTLLRTIRATLDNQFVTAETL
ncbi:MAG: sensor histidine kinase [Planctomycetaceae bacterium]|nr:sensor histidine kinase [Planctomycetaceae bacterium]